MSNVDPIDPISNIPGRIITPFGFQSTADEVAAGIDLAGKRAIVTGASSGIGIETARTLARAGAEVTLAVRNMDAGKKVAAEIVAETGRQNVKVEYLDLVNRASIQEFAANWQGPLHLLINNAGVMAMPEEYTPEGWEMQFATNHLGHFALALALHSVLAAGARDAGGARIVAVSSSAHMRSPVIFDDIHFAFRPYDPILAYAQSKTANILFAVAATEKWQRDGINTNALMPGAIPTNLQRYVGGTKTAPALLKTPQQGAATTILVATSPIIERVGGRYFVNCNEAEPVARRSTDGTGVAPYALDKANADRLWEESLRMIGNEKK